ncbi:MAG: DUF1016 N-terminal domain-containing protein [Elusimicrobiota bacterium]|nr:DUF1016 N-terminal domain-containing protein [Elusimicrobiota bacterium]
MIKATKSPVIGYSSILKNILDIINDARRYSAKSINAVMTATYWEIGRRIVELEQAGKKRAEYGKRLINKLSADLTTKFRRGFGVDNLQRLRLFYTYYPADLIYATLSRKSILKLLSDEKCQTVSGKSAKPLKRQTVSAKSNKPVKPQTPSADLTVQEYKTVLPDVRLLAGELKKTQKMLEGRKSLEEKED